MSEPEPKPASNPAAPRRRQAARPHCAICGELTRDRIGSWNFIISCFVVLLIWIGFNV